MEILFLLLVASLVPFTVIAILPPGRILLIGIVLVVLAIVGFNHMAAPGRGSSDAAGHGMALGYHALLVWAAVLGAATGGLAQLARRIWPGLTGWRYALAAPAIFVGLTLAALSVILQRI